MNEIGYFITPSDLPADYPSHVQWTGANAMLSPPECDVLIGHGNLAGWQDAGIGSPGQTKVDKDYRCVKTASLPYSQSLAWLYKRATERLMWANQAHWRFDLTGLIEPFQLLRYEAAETAEDVPGHYNWHQDFGSGYMGRRKLSLVVQLTPGEEYDGCELSIMGHRQEKLGYRNAGDAVAFPCWTPHFVSPITRGVRHALVAWIHGAPLR